VVCRATALADTLMISITTSGNRTPELYLRPVHSS
jgi:hypothetical protein